MAAKPKLTTENKSGTTASAAAPDVAISFLVADEKIASALNSQLMGLNVFFFPHKQEELVGTNGLESMRAPFLRARTIVVLYRIPWGETPWTGVEQVAITDRCLKERFRPLVFVQLDKNDRLPDWLPNTHVRFVLENYGIEQLAGAVKARVEQLGGIVSALDAMSTAKRVKAEQDYLADRTAMMRDQPWIENVVHASVRSAVVELSRLTEQVNKEHRFQIKCIGRDRVCVLRSDHVSLLVEWKQPIFNTVADDRTDECSLRVAEFSGLVLGPNESGHVWERPTVLKEHKFKVDVSEARELMWHETGKPNRLSGANLADRIMQIFLDLISRSNKGKIR